MECLADLVSSYESEANKIEALFPDSEREELSPAMLEDMSIDEAHLVLDWIMQRVEEYPALALKAAQFVLTNSPSSPYYRGRVDTSRKPYYLSQLRP
jgi:hypothetical protein